MLIYFVLFIYLFIYFSLVNMISLFYCMNINELDTVLILFKLTLKVNCLNSLINLIVIYWFCCGCGRYNNRAGGRKV